MDGDLTELERVRNWEPLLTDNERRLVRYAAIGKDLDLQGRGWDQIAGAVIRARVIEVLALGMRDDWPLHHRGLNIIGCRIDGALNLDFMPIVGPLAFLSCQFGQPISMIGASVPSLELSGTWVSGLAADGLQVTGGVYLRNGFRSTREVRLVQARIGGSLECDGGQFTDMNGQPLDLEGVQVAGSINMRYGFNARGEVRLPRARIGASLECDGGHFHNPSGRALNADLIRVDGYVFLRDGFRANGEVFLLGAEVGGTLHCNGGTFMNPDGHALTADGIQVTGNISLNDGFHAVGEVRLVEARIGRSLNCRGGKFDSPGGTALNLTGIEVEAGVFLRDGFEALGGVQLMAARIGTLLSCDGARLSNDNGPALTADGTQIGSVASLNRGFVATGEVRLPGVRIGGSLECAGAKFRNPEACAIFAVDLEVSGGAYLWDGCEVLGEVQLQGARIGTILGLGGKFASDTGRTLVADDLVVGQTLFIFPDTFEEGVVSLSGASVSYLVDDLDGWPSVWYGSGFVFNDFAGRASTDPEGRIEWLERQGAHIRPGSYTTLANVYRKRGDSEAATSVLVARERHRVHTLSSWRRILYRLWGALSAYGYRPWRAVWFLVGVISIGGTIFAFAPMTATVAEPLPFWPWLYSADLALPLIDFGQASDWRPVSQWVQLCMTLVIALGWFVSAAFVAAVTGLFERQE